MLLIQELTASLLILLFVQQLIIECRLCRKSIWVRNIITWSCSISVKLSPCFDFIWSHQKSAWVPPLLCKCPILFSDNGLPYTQDKKVTAACLQAINESGFSAQTAYLQVELCTDFHTSALQSVTIYLYDISQSRKCRLLLYRTHSTFFFTNLSLKISS